MVAKSIQLIHGNFIAPLVFAIIDGRFFRRLLVWLDTVIAVVNLIVPSNILYPAIDNLLAASDLQEPVKRVRPNVFSLYADPDLEARSSGQKILMRIGGQNEAKVKVTLREIKRQVVLPMQEKKVDGLK